MNGHVPINDRGTHGDPLNDDLLEDDDVRRTIDVEHDRSSENDSVHKEIESPTLDKIHKQLSNEREHLEGAIRTFDDQVCENDSSRRVSSVSSTHADEVNAIGDEAGNEEAIQQQHVEYDLSAYQSEIEPSAGSVEPAADDHLRHSEEEEEADHEKVDVELNPESTLMNGSSEDHLDSVAHVISVSIPGTPHEEVKSLGHILSDHVEHEQQIDGEEEAEEVHENLLSAATSAQSSIAFESTAADVHPPDDHHHIEHDIKDIPSDSGSRKSSVVSPIEKDESEREHIDRTSVMHPSSPELATKVKLADLTSTDEHSRHEDEPAMHPTDEEPSHTPKEHSSHSPDEHPSDEITKEHEPASPKLKEKQEVDEEEVVGVKIIHHDTTAHGHDVQDNDVHVAVHVKNEEHEFHGHNVADDVEAVEHDKKDGTRNDQHGEAEDVQHEENEEAELHENLTIIKKLSDEEETTLENADNEKTATEVVEESETVNTPTQAAAIHKDEHLNSLHTKTIAETEQSPVAEVVSPHATRDGDLHLQKLNTDGSLVQASAEDELVLEQFAAESSSPPRRVSQHEASAKKAISVKPLLVPKTVAPTAIKKSASQGQVKQKLPSPRSSGASRGRVKGPNVASTSGTTRVATVQRSSSNVARRTQSHSPARPSLEHAMKVAKNVDMRALFAKPETYEERKKRRDEYVQKKKAAAEMKQSMDKEQRRKEAEAAFQGWLQRKAQERHRARSTGRGLQNDIALKEEKAKQRGEAQAAFQAWLDRKSEENYDRRRQHSSGSQSQQVNIKLEDSPLIPDQEQKDAEDEDEENKLNERNAL